MKNIIIFVVVVAGAYFAWNNLPGLRDKVTKAANQYGGWTEEARKGDPVGFIEHAIGELKSDITEFKATQTALVENKKTSEAMLEKQRDKQVKATDLAAAIKEQFKTAEETDGWPISLAGKSYERADAITLVNSLLTTQRNSGTLMAKYDQVIATIDAKNTELRSRIEQSQFNIEELTAQKQLVKADTLSAEADELLAKVNDLVEGNSKEGVAKPAENFEELLDDLSKQAKVDEKAAETDEATSAALEFLNG